MGTYCPTVHIALCIGKIIFAMIPIWHFKIYQGQVIYLTLFLHNKVIKELLIYQQGVFLYFYLIEHNKIIILSLKLEKKIELTMDVFFCLFIFINIVKGPTCPRVYILKPMVRIYYSHCATRFFFFLMLLYWVKGSLVI